MESGIWYVAAVKDKMAKNGEIFQGIHGDETRNLSAITNYIENFMHLKSDAHPSHLILRIWSGLNIVESQKETNALNSS